MRTAGEPATPRTTSAVVFHQPANLQQYMGSIEDCQAHAQRLDRWLWATRLFKTRSIAADAINNGRVELNGLRAKPAKLVRIDDTVIVRRPPYTYELTVRELSERRVSAKLVAGLYRETPSSVAAREQLGATLKLGAVIEDRRAGKLNKKERRQREQLKRWFE